MTAVLDGIPEVWRFNGRRLDIHQLSGSKYVNVDSSLALPVLTSDAITNFITQGTKMSRLEWVKNVRTWARQQNTSGEK